MKRVLKGCFVLCCIVLSQFVSANTYYLSAWGNDNNSGLSASDAWRTIQKLNTIDLQPGDSVLFQGGYSFPGNIYLDADDAGTAAQPVFIGSYGTGKATILAGNGIGIQGYNCAGLRISTLQITGAGVNANSGRGIDLYMDVHYDLSFIRIDNCDISGFRGYGIQFGCWDTNFGFNDVRVTYTNSFNNGSGGMISYGFNDVINHKNFYVAYSTFHDNKGRPDVTNTNTGNGIVLSAIENAAIEYCEAYNNGEYNANPAGGPVGIWFYLVKNGLIQYCESHHNNTSTIDGGGFDIDGGSQNCIIQHCYSHDNAGAGYLMAEYGASVPYSGNIIRYNISQNDARKGSSGAIAFWGVDNSHRITQSQVYNNTVYLNADNVVSGTPSAVKLMGGNFSQVKLSNNVFCTQGAVHVLSADVAVDSSALHFLANDYYNSGGILTFQWGGNLYYSLQAWKNAAITQERRGIAHYGLSADPLLVAPGAGGNVGIAQLTQLSTYLQGYRLQQNAIALDAGLDVAMTLGLNVGARDFFGNAPRYGASQDIGAHECSDCYVVLPQRSIWLNAQKQQDYIDVSWGANDESHIAAYIPEFSNNGFDFTKLDSIKAGGFIATYALRDRAYFLHERFYRVQVVQKNGARFYSKTVSVHNDAQPGLDLAFARLADGPAVIFTSDVQQVIELHLYTTEGRLVHKENRSVAQGISYYKLGKRIAAGIYILHATMPSGQSRIVRVVVSE
jgi:hypothetical protein